MFAVVFVAALVVGAITKLAGDFTQRLDKQS